MSRWIRTLNVVIILAVGASCRDDTDQSITDPAASEAEPALATTATAPLAFAQLSAGNSHTCGARGRRAPLAPDQRRLVRHVWRHDG